MPTVQQLAAPTILVTGTQILKSGDSLTDVGVSSSYTTQSVANQSVGKVFTGGDFVSVSGRQYTSNEPLIFLNSVNVDFASVYSLKTTTVAANFRNNIPTNWTIGEIQDNVYVSGEAGNNSPTDAALAEIRYTINGKDPSRTRARRYYGSAATLNFNLNGGDNIIIKARVYRQGQWSLVREAVFRIVQPDNISVAGQIIP